MKAKDNNNNTQSQTGLAKYHKRTFFCVVSALLLAFCSSGHAASARGSSGGGNAALKAVAMEGLVIAASYAAAEKPRGFAVATALLIPYSAALDDQSSTSTKWIGTLIAEGIAVFNYRASDDETIERDEILRKNFIGWNIFAVAVALSEKLTHEKTDQSRSNFNYSLVPLKDGQSLQVSYRF